MSILDNLEEYKAVEAMINNASCLNTKKVTDAIDDLKKDLNNNYMKVADFKYKFLLISIFISISVILSGYAATIKTIDTVVRFFMGAL